MPQTATEYYLLEYLTHLYGGGVAPELTGTLLQIVDQSGVRGAQTSKPLTAADMLLITYGDTVTDGERAPLQVLKEFADATLTPYFSAVHILPFFPFSSDDGFAVVDYGEVRQDLGNWGDVHALAEHFELMFDLVINHCSREHIWFADFVNGRAPGCDFFIEHPADTDLTSVVRPRNTPLLKMNSRAPAKADSSRTCTSSRSVKEASVVVSSMTCISAALRARTALSQKIRPTTAARCSTVRSAGNRLSRRA